MRYYEMIQKAKIKVSSRFGLPIKAIRKLHFDIVHGCQLKCVGCPNSTLDRKISKISTGDFDRCLQNIDVQKISLFRLFNYGEPLLHPDLPGIISQVPKQRFHVDILELSTNAQYHDFDMLTEALKQRILNRLAVSCDGDGTPEDYERLRPPARWARLLEFLSRAAELRDKHAPELKLITRTVCTTEEGQRRWKDVLLPLGWTPEFRGWLALPDSREDLSNKTAAVSGVCSYMDANDLYVDVDGTVVPCCMHPKAFVLGNLMEDTFNGIRGSELRKRIIHQMRTAREGMEVCGRCKY